MLVWLVIWRVAFTKMETIFGLFGLLLIVYAVAVWAASPDWGSLGVQARTLSPPSGESWATYWYYAVALFGAAMTPYEVFFFSSGGVEEHWSRKDLMMSRANVFLGFPLGGFLSLSIGALAAITYLSLGIEVETIGQTALPVALQLGKVGLIVVILGIFAATFGAALETALSSGYAIAQFFGWPWGKMVRPREAPRFHTLVIVVLVGGALMLLTTVDPVLVTEYSAVFSTVALPLTYFPILVIANDPDYLGEDINRPWTNLLGLLYLGLVVLASAAAIPLMIWTKAGQ